MGPRCVVRSTVGCLTSLRHISAELPVEAQASVSHTTGHTTGYGPVRALPAWCSRLAETAPIPHSAHEGEGKVALRPPERTHHSDPLRGCLRRFRY